MKKFFIFISFAIVTLLTACKGEDDNAPKTILFNAVSASYSSGLQTLWVTGDKIALFSDKVYSMSAMKDGETTTFSGEMKKASQYYAIFPYSANFVDGVFPAVVPAEQIVVKNGAPVGASVAYASSQTTDLTFKPATALLKFSLGSDNNIKYVKIASKGSNKPAGSIMVNTIDGKVTINSGEATVTLSNGGNNIEKATYYAAVIPATYVEGLDITVTDEYGRVSTCSSEEFIRLNPGTVYDLGQIDATAEFVAPTLISTPVDLAVKGDGETVTATLSLGFTSVGDIYSPDWATVTVDGNTVNAIVPESPYADDVRYGIIHIEGITSEGPAVVEIPIAQAAKGALLVYDSFSGKELDANNWKGNYTRSDLKYGDGCLKMTGTGEFNNPENTFPLFYMGAKVRQRYIEDGACNQFICTVDIKADGGCGGIMGFNAFGIKADGTCDFISKQNYIAFMSATEGAEGGGYFCFNATSPNAMDMWTKPDNTAITTWLRLEMSNVDRAGDGVEGNWGLKAIWSLEEDASGVLQK